MNKISGISVLLWSTKTLFLRNMIGRMYRIITKLILINIFFIAFVMQLNAATYYVSLNGNDKWAGTSPDSAWQHITHAATQAQASDTVYIKDGNYGNERVVIENSGTIENPIVFEGYNGTPLLDGQDRTGTGIYMISKNYIKIKNIELTRYQYGIRIDSSNHVTMDSIIVTNVGDLVDSYDGWGIFLSYSDSNTVQNCSITDAAAVNYQIDFSNYNLVDNCTAYGIRIDNAVDYYIVIRYSYGNTVQNCLTQNMHISHPEVHPGHGIGIKDTYWNGSYSSPHSYNNKFINCVARGHGEGLLVSHHSHNNEFIDCTVYSDSLDSWWNHAIVIRDGAYDNTFRNIRAKGPRSGVLFMDTDESPTVTIQTNNTIENCIFDVTDFGADIGWAENNVFKNCIITGTNTTNLWYGHHGETGNSLRNCIVFNISGLGNPNITYSAFWNNDFTTPAGTGNIEIDPLFIDTAVGDFHLKSEHGRWNGSSWIIDAITSSCIDSGNPADDYSDEPEPNGGRINIGAYGNTNEASKSSFFGIKDNIINLPKIYALHVMSLSDGYNI